MAFFGVAAGAAIFRRPIFRAPRVFKQRKRLEDISDLELSSYRLTRERIREIVEGYGDSEFANTTKRSHAIEAETQVLVALRYFAKGGMLSETAEIHGVSKTSASRCVEAVAKYLCTLAPNFVQLPDDRNELARLAREFQDVGDLSRVIGCVDGTHVRVKAPQQEEWNFVNRKGDHSINVQLMCDAKLKIRDCVARWPGCTHDSFILTNSSLSQRMVSPDKAGLYILGDSGYPLKTWLMTPLLDPESRQERRYNYNHKKMRSSIERCIGVLKSRFRCLHKTGGIMQLKMSTCCAVMQACCVLHNMCCDDNLPNPEIDDDDDNQDDQFVANNGETGQQLRQSIINTF